MTGRGTPLRVLIVGDSENDALLLLRELGRGGYEPVYERVSTPEGMERALEEASERGKPWEVVLSDYYMPRFGGPDALDLLRGLGYDTPFIVVSGKIGEDAAVAMMRAGAQDYVAKENMARLCPAIERELREAEGRRERERAEQALRESEERYRVVAETASDAIVVIDEDSRILFINNAAEKIFGYARVEMLGQRLTMLMPERLREVHEASLERYLDTGRRRLDWSSIRLPGLHKSGEEIPLEVSFGEFVKDGRRFFTGFARDITERKEAERRLREAETRYRALVEQIPAVTYIQEPIESSNPKAITYMSPQYETMLGYPSRSGVIDEEHWLGTLHPEDRERVLAEEAKTDASGEPFRIEYRVIAGDGRVVWVRDQAMLVHDEGGRPLYWLGVQYDVTDQKRAEEELKESEERFRATFEQAAVGMALVDLGGRWLRVNQKLSEIVGYSGEELLQMTFQDITYPDDLDTDLEQVRRLLAGEIETYSMEKRYLKKDGTIVWINLTASLGRNPNGAPRHFIAVVEDISERKQAQEALRRSEERFRSLVQNSSDVITVTTADGTILYQSPSIERVLGYRAEDLLGTSGFDSMEIHPDDLARIREIYADLLARPGGTASAEVRIRHADGSWRVIESFGSNLLEDPSVGGIVSNYRDITERKRAEKALREAREAERNRIARDLHDDILQNIVYSLQEIQIVQVTSEDGAAPGLEEAAEALRRSVEGLRGAIFELRLRETLGQSFVSSLEALLDLNRRMTRKRCEVELVVEEGFPRTLLEKSGRELVRIVQEALANVRRHAEARHVRVRLWRDGDLARVEVADDGRGFDTGNPRVGVGQQSMRHRALEIGGVLEVESAPGSGTRVRFEAPVFRLIGS
jgi:PAS domain S-box-containing protein